MIRDSIKRNKINLTINKNSTKDYIHINDVIDIVFKIIKKGKKKYIMWLLGKILVLTE